MGKLIDLAGLTQYNTKRIQALPTELYNIDNCLVCTFDCRTYQTINLSSIDVGVTINWGDGTVETATVAGLKTHTYSSAKIYVVTISGITVIPNVMFFATPLIDIKIPNTVTEIQAAALYNTQLKELVIPDSVTTLSNACIGGNSVLKRVFIGSGITNFGLSITDDENLPEVYITASTPPNIEYGNEYIQKFYVPLDSLNAYKTDSNWAYLQSKIVAIPDTAYVDNAIATAISTVYKIQGSSTISALNSLTKSATMNGYVYDLTDAGNLVNQDSSVLSVLAGDNVVFIWNNGSWKWDKLAGTIDLSNYYNKTQSDDRYVQKTLTIAGNALSSDISTDTLLNSLFVITTESL